MVDPNVRVFDCGGVLVELAISEENCVELNFYHDGIAFLSPRFERDKPLIEKLFPNGYTKPSDPKPEQATEVTE